MTAEVLTPTSFAGLKITRPADLQLNVNMLIYGEAGVGKTWLAGSADAVPEMRNVMYIDAESGASTLKQSWPKVKLVSTTKWDDYDRLYNALLAGAHDYRTVVLDSLSEIIEHCKEAIMEEMVAKPQNADRDEDLLGIQEWGKVLTRMLRLVRRFRDLPMNVIFIAHAEPTKDKMGKIKWMPLVNGKFQMKLPQIPDVVLYMFMKEVEGEQKRLLLTQQSDKAVAKARGVDMPTIIGADDKNPATMANIMGYYNKEQ